MFQFDLSVQVIDGAARSMLGVCVGERDMRGFDLVVGREGEVVLRGEREFSMRGVMRVAMRE